MKHFATFIVATSLLSTIGPAVSGASETPPTKAPASWFEDQKKQCDALYRGKIQAGIRRACYLGGSFTDSYFEKTPAVAETACRLQYGEEPGETFACLIGTRVAREVAQKSSGSASGSNSEFLKAFQLCSEVYPMRTELDSYLLESCLIGIYVPTLTGKAPRFDLCTTVTHERSFYGPCTVGVSLAHESKIFTGEAKAPSETTTIAPSHRALCEKYFDHLRFHLGYRSCLNARAVKSSLLERAQTVDEIRNRCDAVVSDPANDHERGACLVGAALMDSILSAKPVSIFDGCGVKQVRYEDRDFLGCLAAGSILFFKKMNISSSLSPDRTCKEVFRDRKSQALAGCLNSISSLSQPKE